MKILLRAVMVLGVVGGVTWGILTYEPCLSPVDAAEVDGQSAAFYRVRYRRGLLVWNGQPILFDGLGVEEDAYLLDTEPVMRLGSMSLWRLDKLVPGDRPLGRRTAPYAIRVGEHETVLTHRTEDDGVVRRLVLDHGGPTIKKIEAGAAAE